MQIENQIEFPAPDIEDDNYLLKEVFKVEKEKNKIERNTEVKKRKIILPTDSFFSETFNNSILVKPTFINWDHSYEKPISPNS